MSPARAVDRASIVVKSVRLTDNGDNDGYADPNETVNVYVTLRNSSGADRNGIVVTVASTDTSVDCIPTPVVAFGSLAAGETLESTTAAVLRVANVARSDPFADLAATLDFQISGDDFGGTKRAQEVVLDLDLNISGGLLPTSFSEGFESGGFGTFTTMTLDANINSNVLSDGYRCQYNDPDFANSNDPGRVTCFLGAANLADNAYDWHVHTTTSPDGGRAYLGNNSLHWGVHSSGPSLDTTRLRQLDAIRTTLPVNLGWNGVTPELSFKHQVSLNSCDFVGCFTSDPPSAVDRGIVQIQLATSTAGAIGNWRTISPYENLYDARSQQQYSNCVFDPIDDGTTEDDFFHPEDPARRLGPSSTCAPEFAFSRMGAIFYTDTFDPLDIHHASDGPGLHGSMGPGTWVESKFDLSRYRGRRMRLRFLATSIEVGNALTLQQALGWGPIEADDGWYIDDIRVTNTVTGAATIAVDTANRSGLPACGPVCGSVTASLTASPPGPVGPNQEVTLDASGSSADQCPGGELHYRFWTVNADGFFEPPDSVIQEWSPAAVITHVSNSSTRYGVEVRCSTHPVCAGSAFVLVPFQCPSYDPWPFPEPIGFVSPTQISWEPVTSTVDVIRGDLLALRASGGQFNGTVEACVVDSTFDDTVLDLNVPDPGQGFYYLVKRNVWPLCGYSSWGTGSPAEVPGAGGDRDADIPLDPQTCPD